MRPVRDAGTSSGRIATITERDAIVPILEHFGLPTDEPRPLSRTRPDLGRPRVRVNSRADREACEPREADVCAVHPDRDVARTAFTFDGRLPHHDETAEEAHGERATLQRSA